MRQRLPIASDHPAYAGHFPGRPLLPGVVLLAEAMAAIGGDWTVDSAKFLMPVAPGTELDLSHATTQAGGVRFEIHSPAGLVATGHLLPARA